MDDDRRSLALAATSLAAFAAVVCLVVVGGPVPRLDVAIRNAVDAHRDPTLTTAFRHVTDVLQPLVVALVLAAGATALARRVRRLMPLVAAGVTGWTMAVVVIGLKHLVGRSGPHPVDPSGGTAFPSGHTASTLVCLGALALLLRLRRPQWVRPLLAVVGGLTVVVTVALVYDGYHWASDCVASALLGVGLLALLDRWLTRWLSRRRA